MRKYLYCIIPCQQEITFDAKGISDEGSAVHTVCYENLAAVVSDAIDVRSYDAALFLYSMDTFTHQPSTSKLSLMR